jgi:hypothetical protein
MMRVRCGPMIRTGVGLTMSERLRRMRSRERLFLYQSCTLKSANFRRTASNTVAHQGQGLFWGDTIKHCWGPSVTRDLCLYDVVLTVHLHVHLPNTYPTCTDVNERRVVSRLSIKIC